MLRSQFSDNKNVMVMLCCGFIFIWISSNKLSKSYAYPVRSAVLHIKFDLQNEQTSNNSIISASFWCIIKNTYMKLAFKCKTHEYSDLWHFITINSYKDRPETFLFYSRIRTVQAIWINLIKKSLIYRYKHTIKLLTVFKENTTQLMKWLHEVSNKSWYKILHILIINHYLITLNTKVFHIMKNVNCNSN